MAWPNSNALGVQAKLYIPKPGELLNELPPLPRLGEPFNLTMETQRQPLFDLGSSRPYNYLSNTTSTLNGQTVSNQMAASRLKATWKRDSEPLATLPTPPLTPPGPPAPRPAPGQLPNKIAGNDPRWMNKAAFSSAELAKRQSMLETYSAEIEMLFDAVSGVLFKVTGRRISLDDVSFYANFGNPIVNNSQVVSVTLTSPFEVAIKLTRTLTDKRLTWTAEMGSLVNTPMTVGNKFMNLDKGNGQIAVQQPKPEPIGAQGEELPSVEKDKKRRKVTL